LATACAVLLNTVEGRIWANNSKSVAHSMAASAVAADKVSSCSRSFAHPRTKCHHPWWTNIASSRIWRDIIEWRQQQQFWWF